MLDFMGLSDRDNRHFHILPGVYDGRYRMTRSQTEEPFLLSQIGLSWPLDPRHSRFLNF